MEMDRSRIEFFANISHELRTPLNVIMSSLQMSGKLLYRTSPINENNKIEKYNAIIKQNCYRLLRLINNLIDSTKIDAGYLELNLVNCNIVNLIEEITLSVEQYASSRGITLEFDTDTEEKTIALDTDKIERVILNLLSNAIKFTKPGGKINVNLFCEQDAVTVSVKDTGVGIPSEKQEEVFTRFVRVDPLLTRDHEGSGIGLSLSKSIVELHGGTIMLRSEQGMGSNFIVRLPARVIDKKPEDISQKVFTSQDRIEKVNIEFSDIYNTY
jgi:signal transduction histidine kinase